MKPEITVCKPSRRNQPKSYIKCSNPCTDVRYGTMVERKAKIELEIHEAVDAQLMRMRG